MRSKNADQAIVLFFKALQRMRYGAIKDITADAEVGATIGSAFKELKYVKKINGAYYYTGPDQLPIDEIAAKYYEIRSRHTAGGKLAAAMKEQKEQRHTSKSDSFHQKSTEKTYTKTQVIEAFKAFYIKEYGKMSGKAYMFAGMLESAL